MISCTHFLAAQLASKSWPCKFQRQAGLVRRLYSSNAATEDKPLRILFCGSDDFSIASLRALYHHSRLATSNVASIDVATRPDKAVGRNRQKNVLSPPIKHAAEQLMLPVHQFDTFRGWDLPTLRKGEKPHINMVIAVSFGLLVPPRILRQCEFGGLNVHPSLLPDLKGSSPVEHTILHGDLKTGVTVQTLHESKFDEGEIVLQTPRPGLSIPDPNSITASQLKDLMSGIGAEMLVRTIRDRLYLNPRGSPVSDRPNELRMAPKLSTESRHVNFASMTSVQVFRMKRALGDLWAVPVTSNATEGVDSDMRLKFKDVDLRLARRNELENITADTLLSIEPGRPFCVFSAREKVETSIAPLFVKTADKEVLAIERMIVSGMPLANASALAARAQLFEDDHVLLENPNRKLLKFRHILQ